MCTAVVTCVLAAVLGQAPAESAWLKAVPAEAEVVVHLRGVKAFRDDAMEMLKAMSPFVADQVNPFLDMMLQQVEENVGRAASNSPMLVAMRLPKADDMQAPPAMAIMVPATDYDAIMKGLAGDAAKVEKQAGGYDMVKTRDGETLYIVKGEGFVAICPFKDDMAKTLAAKPTATLGGMLNGDVQKLLFSGDLSMHLNLAAIQTQYADQIKEAKDQLMDMLDQAGGQVGNEEQMQQAKAVYAAMFDALKVGESLTMSIDMDKEALDIAGLVTVKAGSDAARTLTTAKLSNAAALAALPSSELAYMYLSFDPAGMEGLMRMGMVANAAGGQFDEAAMKKLIEDMKAAGRQETVSAISLGRPVTVVSITTAENPEKAMEATRNSIANMRGASPLMKDVKVEENALDYRGFKLAKISMTFDFEKLAEQAQGNEQVTDMLKRFMGESMTSYMGGDGKRTLSVVAANDTEAKAKIDAALSGSGGIGETAGYKAMRARMPEQVGALVVLNAQQIIKQLASMAGRLVGGEFKEPSMPKETAVFGMSYAATPAGYRFNVVVPTAVGPVFEQGLGSLMQALQGQVGQ